MPLPAQRQVKKHQIYKILFFTLTMEDTMRGRCNKDPRPFDEDIRIFISSPRLEFASSTFISDIHIAITEQADIIACT